MKIIIFAGGVGKRLWPLSRKSTPKQFQKLFGDETSLENSYNTIKNAFGDEDIYISTGEQYTDQVLEAMPTAPKENLIVEPNSRDTGPAVAFAMMNLFLQHPDEPVVIRWQNSLIKDPKMFNDTVLAADKLFQQGEAKMVYLAVPARYANTTVGYIKVDQKIDKIGPDAVYNFDSFREKPAQDLAEKYVEDGMYGWNPGCYITTPRFVIESLKQHRPEFYSHLERIGEAIQQGDKQKITELFENLEKLSIDYLLWEKLEGEGIKVIVSDYKWYYVSNWTDLKIALQENAGESVTKGNVIMKQADNNLVYSYDSKKLVAVFGVDKINVIDTGDALLICSQEHAGRVKELFELIEEANSDKL